MLIPKLLKSGWAKPILFACCLLPFLLLVWNLFQNRLGANPVEMLTHETGEWTLRLLLLTLAVSPLRQWSGIAAIARFRRMLGLFAYFYVCCHFLVWFVFDHSLDVNDMIEDILDRPYITLGFCSFMLMAPLAITSNQVMIRKLGRSWNRLHRLVYPVAILGVLHFLWLVKADYLEPGIYALILLLLLLHRIDPLKRISVKFSRLGNKTGEIV